MTNILSYFARPLQGPNISAFLKAIQNFFNISKPTIDYLSLMSISTAKEKHLEMIGRLMGFERPIIDTQAFSELLFRFSSEYDSSIVGFSSEYGSSGGGLLDYTFTVFNYMPLDQFRNILLILKEGFASRSSIFIIDKICAYYSPSYTLEWDSNHDIVVKMYDTGTYSLATAQYVFDTLYTVSPVVNVQKGIL